MFIHCKWWCSYKISIWPFFLKWLSKDGAMPFETCSNLFTYCKLWCNFQNFYLVLLPYELLKDGKIPFDFETCSNLIDYCKWWYNFKISIWFSCMTRSCELSKDDAIFIYLHLSNLHRSTSVYINLKGAEIPSDTGYSLKIYRFDSAPFISVCIYLHLFISISILILTLVWHDATEVIR